MLKKIALGLLFPFVVLSLLGVFLVLKFNQRYLVRQDIGQIQGDAELNHTFIINLPKAKENVWQIGVDIPSDAPPVVRYAPVEVGITNISKHLLTVNWAPKVWGVKPGSRATILQGPLIE